ncbi:M81 family peptidase [Mesorhizobium sp. M2A.F.Ca.ET.043.05.1.1]|uniref:M81 family metallopeptidase n=1 Tax=Mesorhizobium sp. M2A.F.Ca.ET.043.05.1.1 TaxID=2493671 RepID=UPI000F753B6A|nr:M81 family metallopeptidase [Mesorhizobium sp. M2A.F.Ca.ET.043.05.1.1]AZO18919.1 M81 family peptidase [Mesorhizobium sp. M2A.F.Ca.ET.043.05.1.1]
MRVMAAFWQQETNTFNPHLTTLQRFRHGALMFGEDIAHRFRGTDTDWGALLERAQSKNWELVTPLHAHAGSSGALTGSTFEELADILLEPLREPRSVEGILLMLHGSMVSERIQDCEGEILWRVRQLAGWDVPVVLTLDPHANVSHRMADMANAIVAYRTTPHLDQAQTTQLACQLLSEMVEGGALTQVKLIKPPLLAGLDSARTTSKDGPMPRILALAERLTVENPAIRHISVQAGFSYGDVADIGPSAAITCSRATDDYHKESNALAREMWTTRAERTVTFHSVCEGLQIAENLARCERPVVVVDYADNPGGGAAGDDVSILKAMLERGTRDAFFFSLWAPEAVESCFSAGLNKEVRLTLGCDHDLKVTGHVKALTPGDYLRRGAYFRNTIGNLGASCLVLIQGIKVALTSIAIQTEEREQFKLFGVHFESEKLVVCKGMNHFRADLEPLSQALVFVDSGKSCTANYASIPYERVRRPIWPLDDFQ